MAGLLLKNKLRASVDCLGQEDVEILVKDVLSGPMIKLLASAQSSSFIQRTIGTILSTLVTDCNGLNIWPSLINDLLQIDNTTAALSVIERICEDAAFELIEHPETFKKLLETLFLLLQQGIKSSAAYVSILNIICHLIPTQSPLLTGNTPFLLEQVLKLDTSDEIKIMSCRLLSALLEFYWPLLDRNHLQPIFDFVLQLTIESKGADDKDLLKQCLEFWLFQVQFDSANDILPVHLNEPHLSHLIPLLMETCSYDDEEDEDELCKAMEDLSVPDEEDDLKPRHHRPKEGEQLDDFIEANDSTDDDSIVTSIRKCSAATLDGLSLCIPPNSFLKIFLPAFYQRVGSTDWKIREGSLLAFGAIAEGLLHNLSQQADQIAPFLLANSHSHPHPLVRSMSIWTISRTASWFTNDLNRNAECMKILIGSLGDSNKRVQQSAATTICKFLESSEAVFSVDDRKSLISAIFLALKCYQRRSLLILYDLIRLFGAFDFGDGTNLLNFDPEAFQYWRSIVLILIDRFDPKSIADSSIFPIIEALMSLLLLDYDGHFIDRSKRDEMDFKALSLAAQNLTALKEAQMDGFGDSIVSEGLDDFLIAALDLLAAATESSKLVPSQQLQPLLRNILCASLLFKDSSNVRQSAFALIGDYALSSSPQILHDPQLESVYFQAIQQNCFPSSLTAGRDEMIISMATATNAVWSIGEVALSTQMSIPAEILNQLVSILRDRPSLEAGARIYFENLAVSIGRILATSTIVNNIHITSNFLNRIMNLLMTVESSEERASALAGYIRIVRSSGDCSVRDYQLIISKVNELIDFSDTVDLRLSQNLSGFTRPDISPDFFTSFQPNLTHLLLSSNK